MKTLLLLVSCACLLSACDKGYQLRFTNLYIEKIDTLRVGLSGAVFTDIGVKETTSFVNVRQGLHALKFVTHSGQVFWGSCRIPAKGSGERTIQLDAIKQISVYEGPLQ